MNRILLFGTQLTIRQKKNTLPCPGTVSSRANPSRRRSQPLPHLPSPLLPPERAARRSPDGAGGGAPFPPTLVLRHEMQRFGEDAALARGVAAALFLAVTVLWEGGVVAAAAQPGGGTRASWVQHRWLLDVGATTLATDAQTACRQATWRWCWPWCLAMRTARIGWRQWESLATSG